MSSLPVPAGSEEIAIAVVRDGRDVLVTRRGPDVAFADHDEFPGGHREPGESLVECLHRELAEETGLQVIVVGLLDVRELPTSRGHRRLSFFDCRLAGARPARLDGSAADPRWVPVEELGALRFPPANTPVLRQLETLGPLSEEA